MSTTTDTSKLDDLIVTTIDSIRGYEGSAEHARSPELVAFFREMAADRRAVVDELQAQSRAIGGTPNDFGSAAATVHRGWENLRVALGGGDAAIVAEVERGEDYLKEEFERALGEDSISPETRAVIARCHSSVLAGHNRARALRHMLKDAA